MRDYEFGNHLAELRKSHGYSQFQLGTLVGVSDKAVSKWENGASKPRIAVIMKLAAILGVEMDDLLKEAHEQFPQDREKLSLLKKQIWAKAESKMKELYGNVPHLAIRNRFLMEKNALGSSDAIVLLDTLRELASLAKEEGSYLPVRNLVNCFFTAWLIGATDINPLPAHYYCPKCHKTMFIDDSNCGWELPEKQCDCCSTGMMKDGHNLPFEISVCGTNEPLLSVVCNAKDYLVDKAWEKVLEKLTPYYSFKRHSVKTLSEHGEGQATVIFLNQNVADKEMQTLDSIPEIDEETYWSYIGTDTPSFCIIPSDKITKLAPDDHSQLLNKLLQPEMLTNAFKAFLDERKQTDKMLAAIDNTHKDEERYTPKMMEISSFDQLVEIMCALHGSFSTPDLEELAATIGVNDYKKLPFSREDVWFLIHKCSDHPEQISGIASEIVYKIRRGSYSKALTDDDRTLFQQLNLPEWFSDYARNVHYLFPKCSFVAGAYQLLLDHSHESNDA